MLDATTTAADATDTTTTATTDDGRGGKQAVLADLAAERDKRQELEKQLAAVQTKQDEQAKALALAFGIAPEETSDVTKLASQVQLLQDQFAASQRQNIVLSLAAEHGITDPEAIADLAAITDEQAMRRLAGRLANTTTEAATAIGRLLPDLTQGGHSDAGAKRSPGQEFAAFLNRQLT